MNNHFKKSIVIAACTFFIGVLWCNTVLGKSDDEVAQAMGTPYYCGEILPTPQEVVYKPTSVVLADGVSGKQVFDLRFNCGQHIQALLKRLFQRRVKSYVSEFDVQWAKADAAQTIPICFELVSDNTGQSDPKIHPDLRGH